MTKPKKFWSDLILWIFGGLSIRAKILVMLAGVGVGSVAVAGYLGNLMGQNALRERISAQFAQVRAAKKFEVENYFDRILKQAATWSEDPAVIQATREFTVAFRRLNVSTIAPEWENQTSDYYRLRFVPELTANMGGAMKPDRYFPVARAAQYLQHFYAMGGHHAEITDPGDGSDYSKLHARYHPIFRQYAERFGYSDILLVDDGSGDVIYSVRKDPDFTSNVASGAFAQTNFSRAVQASRDSPKAGEAKLVDFEPYAPSMGRPQAFVASPIFSGLEHVGDLVLQISVDDVDRIMTDDRHWREHGLGETGENYIVGADHLMRSNARGVLEDPKAYVRRLRASGVPEDKLRVIENLKTSILQHEARTPAVEAALGGNTGTNRMSNYTGEAALSSYTPLQIPGLKWVLVSEIAVSEASAPIYEFQYRLRWASFLMAIVVGVAGWILATVFIRPVNELIRGAREFGEGKINARVDLPTQDEFGQLAHTFNDMVRRICEDRRIVEQKNAENERLLLNILPEPIAERLKMGESSIADGFADVTVLFGDLVGFTAFSAGVPAEQIVSFLNDLFRRFDEAALRRGIEKIKTIGDCYMAVSGLPTPHDMHVYAALDMALDMLRIISEFNREHGTSLQIRIGLNSGPVVAGVIGSSKFIYDLWGDTVNLASRMESTGLPGAIQVTTGVRERAGNRYEFEERGLVEVKGKGKIQAWLLKARAAELEEAGAAR